MLSLFIRATCHISLCYEHNVCLSVCITLVDTDVATAAALGAQIPQFGSCRIILSHDLQPQELRLPRVPDVHGGTHSANIFLVFSGTGGAIW